MKYPCLLSTLWVGHHPSLYIIVLTVLSYSFFSDSIVSLPAAVVVTLTPHPGAVSVRISMIFVPISTGLLIGNHIASIILKYGWLGLQIFCGTYVMLSVVSITTARVARVGWALKEIA